jgi:DNA-binding NarL/FixJ family response regulator
VEEARVQNRALHSDAGVEPSRIVLVDLPRIMREIIQQAIADEPDMVIVNGSLPADLRGALERSAADFVISGADHELAEVGALLEERPRLRVLSVVGDGREAFLYELRPTRTPLGEVSPRTIVDAIRSARCETS